MNTQTITLFSKESDFFLNHVKQCETVDIVYLAHAKSEQELRRLELINQ